MRRFRGQKAAKISGAGEPLLTSDGCCSSVIKDTNPSGGRGCLAQQLAPAPQAASTEGQRGDVMADEHAQRVLPCLRERPLGNWASPVPAAWSQPLARGSCALLPAGLPDNQRCAPGLCTRRDSPFRSALLSGRAALSFQLGKGRYRVTASPAAATGILVLLSLFCYQNGRSG